jgi:hypothetical protein
MTYESNHEVGEKVLLIGKKRNSDEANGYAQIREINAIRIEHLAEGDGYTVEYRFEGGPRWYPEERIQSMSAKPEEESADPASE